MSRLHNLDYLRGIAALGIMLYHYSSWSFGNWSSEHIMGRVGVYGVSIFYILSGLTMSYVYLDKIELNSRSILDFFRKRFFRIYPLLWLASIASIALAMKVPSVSKIILNLTGLFGLFDWDNYIAPGAWSIGNELVFYLFVPVFIYTMRSQKILFWILSLSITFAFLYFAFFQISSESALRKEWVNYVNPLNQAFFFLGGFVVSWLLKSVHFSRKISVSLILLGVSIFIFFPAQGDLVGIITDVPRLIFSISCLLICVGFFKIDITLSNVIHKPLSLLGEGSYSLYLLHPIVYKFLFLLNKHLLHFSTTVIVLTSIVSTFALSYFVYTYFEKFFMKLAKSSSITAKR